MKATKHKVFMISIGLESGAVMIEGLCFLLPTSSEPELCTRLGGFLNFAARG